jgi:hypothetical protein
VKEIPDIKLGTVLFSIADAKPGFAHAYNRWYERDHFFAGCMVGANFFSGKRWIATKPLKAARFPAAAPEIGKGSFLHLYWILQGTYAETLRWSVDQVQQLYKQERMEPPRENISSGFYRYEGGVFRDDDGVPAELALEHPYRAVSVVMIDRAGKVPEADFSRWLEETWLPHFMARSPVAMTLILRPEELPADAPANVPRPGAAELERRVLLLSFLEDASPAVWADKFQAFARSLTAAGMGEVVFASPFIPTVPGTDKYVDEI